MAIARDPYSRFIPVEEIASVQQWDFGTVATNAQIQAAQAQAEEEAKREAMQRVTQAELDRKKHYEDGLQAGLTQGRSQGMEKGLAQGKEQGYAQAKAEWQKKMDDFLANQAREEGERLASLVTQATQQMEVSRQRIARGVLELSCALARQVLRREISIDPQVLVPVVHEAVDLLGTQHRTALLRLHPADMAVLEPYIAGAFADLRIGLRPDETITPGGCLLESAGTVIDASIENRWKTVVSRLGLDEAWQHHEGAEETDGTDSAAATDGAAR
ncbi:FliH/SctL family protein [Candidatus Symbiobacter mobilis]|uniref:Flagellar assembly protein FliH n=1 Tax=Candidatus Symbiobacter mobilis CR TaxID=946483 RepID=U5NA11_9BURK|nr:FliH/SctL family protein [Candidatus Symbiobacter mobilis]AGX88371.1 flagellar assembly protein FliH [Candidatus Symbiobacter mobilis CR]